jgi:hypothetical protein
MVNAAGDLYFPNEEGMWSNVAIAAPPGCHRKPRAAALRREIADGNWASGSAAH